MESDEILLIFHLGFSGKFCMSHFPHHTLQLHNSDNNNNNKNSIAAVLGARDEGIVVRSKIKTDVFRENC